MVGKVAECRSRDTKSDWPRPFMLHLLGVKGGKERKVGTTIVLDQTEGSETWQPAKERVGTGFTTVIVFAATLKWIA